MTATRIQQLSRLTKLEWEILQHRLEVPDAIAEAIGERFETVDKICASIERIGPKKTVSKWGRRAERVLADAVEGSTFWACAKSDMASPQRLAAIARAGESLADKIGWLVGEPLEFPTW